jgi:ubiquinone/menaquinone biosynthesis C-methylase UbiE
MKEDNKRTIAGVFDRSSATYDTVGPRFFEYFGSTMVKFANIPKNSRVLDVATGCGASLFAASNAVGPEGHVIGIDISGGMVEQTQKKINKLGLLNARAEQMDGEDIKFPDALFDFVLAGFCLLFFQEPERFLKEARRVLMPGGKIVLSTWGWTDTRDWHLNLAKKHLPPAIDTGKVPQCLTKKFEDPSEVKAILESAGFKIIETKHEEKDFFYTTEDEWWSAQYSHGIRATLENIEKVNGKEGLERFQKEAFEMLWSLKQQTGFRQTMKALFVKAER